MRPTQFSALKVLDPLNDPEENSEDNDGDRDHQQICHPNSLRLRLRVKQTCSSGACHPVLAPFMRGQRAFLTDPMQDMPGQGTATPQIPPLGLAAVTSGSARIRSPRPVPTAAVLAGATARWPARRWRSCGG